MTYLARVRGTGGAGSGVGAREVAESRRLLAAALRRRREARETTQVRLAAVLGSSQSRVAKMEAADPTVSLELLVRGLVALGATRAEVGRIVGARRAAARAALAADHSRRG